MNVIFFVFVFLFMITITKSSSGVQLIYHNYNIQTKLHKITIRHSPGAVISDHPNFTSENLNISNRDGVLSKTYNTEMEQTIDKHTKDDHKLYYIYEAELFDTTKFTRPSKDIVYVIENLSTNFSCTDDGYYATISVRYFNCPVAAENFLLNVTSTKAAMIVYKDGDKNTKNKIENDLEISLDSNALGTTTLNEILDGSAVLCQAR